MKNIWILAAFGVCSLGCDDALEPAQRIDEPRVLGVRLSTERGEASLVPGEPALAELLLAGPDGPQAARIAYRFCEAASSQRGVPYCVSDAFAEGVTDVSAGPLVFDVPTTLEPGARLALLGVGCPDGEPTLADTPLDDRCSSAAKPLSFSFDAWTQRDVPRLNPDLAGLTVTLAGDIFATSPAHTAPACDDATPSLEAGQKHLLELDLGPASASTNELQISHFSTRGKLERQFSFLAEKQAPRVTLTWHTPREAGPVKQYLVVRDGSGGVSWATWNVCVR